MTVSLVCHARTYLERKKAVLACCCLSPMVGSEWHVRMFDAYSYVQVTRVTPSMVAGAMVIEVRMYDGRTQMYSESQWHGLNKFPVRQTKGTLSDTLLDAEYRIFGTATGRLRSTVNQVSIRK
jgi:hypothetical protein